MRERIEREYRYKEYSDEWLIERYFRYGSVEDALSCRNTTIPFSFADYHRKLEKFGIIKSAGRHTSLSEALHFFRIKQMEPGAPLESIYKTMTPSFQTSIATLHRIYNRVLETKHRVVATRHATALIISNEQDKILVGTELFSETKYGKIAGHVTIPMTFSKVNDTSYQRILRVLQQEVVTEDAIQKKFADQRHVLNILSQVIGPVLTYRLLDVEISCFLLHLPDSITKFNSFKLAHYRFIDKSEVRNDSDHLFRIGVPEMVSKSFDSLKEGRQEVVNSDFNISLFTEVVPSPQLALRYSK